MSVPTRVPTALTIAGSDSGGGAGIQADLKTFAAFGVYGTSAITAVTAQNTAGVAAFDVVAVELVSLQIETVAGDIDVHSTKTGMLANAAVVEAVAAAIRELDLPLVVVDPVMLAKSGEALLDVDGVRTLKAELLPCARVVTPNIPEAEVLSGIGIRSLTEAREAARRIQGLGASAVVIKGGHGTGDVLVDLLLDGDQFTELPTPRLHTLNTHGTGCTFAAAIAAGLALGHPLDRATADAQSYVAGAIRHGLAIGHGRGTLDHSWRIRG